MSPSTEESAIIQHEDKKTSRELSGWLRLIFYQIQFLSNNLAVTETRDLMSHLVRQITSTNKPCGNPKSSDARLSDRSFAKVTRKSRTVQ